MFIDEELLSFMERAKVPAPLKRDGTPRKVRDQDPATRQRNLDIVLSHFGFGDEDSAWLTLAELADRYDDLTRERIRQIIEITYSNHLPNKPLPVAAAAAALLSQQEIWLESELIDALIDAGHVSELGHTVGLLAYLQSQGLAMNYGLYLASLQSATRSTYRSGARIFVARDRRVATLRNDLKAAQKLPGRSGLAKLSNVKRRGRARGDATRRTAEDLARHAAELERLGQARGLRLGDALAASQAATGQTAAVQSSNQILSVLAEDLAALRGVLLAQSRLMTTLTLGAGETLTAKAAGDTVRWQMAEARSGEGGDGRTHVLLKPLQRGLETNLVLTTDRHVYLVALRSGGPDGFNAAVAWDLPAEAAEVAPEAAATAAEAIAPPTPVAVNTDYRIETRGRRPAWTPTAVFDDGRRTFIVFPPSLSVGEAPALFVLAPGGEAQFVNYRQAGAMYVVDRVFDQAELRLGDRRPRVVRLRFVGARS